MGGPRRTPGEAVQAITEALDIIRGIWAADDRRPLRVPGEFHHVAGAKRGPAPTRDIPIVLGAYGPRMLRLIGRQADGWLPSLANLPPGGLTRGNALIDEAAQESGRDPTTIRRWLNIPGGVSAETSAHVSAGTGSTPTGAVRQWVDELTEIALIDGVSTFVLSSDDVEVMRVFAEEVAPEVRAAVDRARASSTVAPR
jgi:alkanesulfonate monooxygenase SsuD/methylene tetrahydromethanopterin reductase-like flavin-dependent oxidoreductase (luciferase family)